MPTYEYACKDCGQHLEVVQSFRDEALTECPACEGTLRKVFSAAGIIFKGSGWHVKDYASSATRSAGRDDQATGESSDGPSEATAASTAESATSKGDEKATGKKKTGDTSSSSTASETGSSTSSSAASSTTSTPEKKTA